MSTTTQTETTTQNNSISVTSESPIPSGPVSSNIIFFKGPEDGSVAFNYVEDPPEGQPQRNIQDDTHLVQISDIRGSESSFSLNTNGFTTLQDVPSEIKYEDWEDDEVVKKAYYAETEKLLLSSVPGATRIHIFDHTIRRTGPDSNRGPVQRAHIDQTAKSLRQRVRNHMGAEAETLLANRVRLINVWRPLKGPVKAFPLAMADSKTVRDEDLVPVEHRYPRFTGETAGVQFEKEQRWWYLSGMVPGERILLQCFDSAGGMARVGHTAFVDPRSPKGEGRESIEVRALVFG